MRPLPAIWLKRLFQAATAVIVLALAMMAFAIERLAISPRSLGPYLERRAEGHNPLIVGFGKWANRTLTVFDRGDQAPFSLPTLHIGAQPMPAGLPQAAAARVVLVDSAAAASTAIGQARSGDIITFLPGTYRFSGSRISASQPGAADNPITVRARQPGSVKLEFDLEEGFHVTAPFWLFENLTISGACSDHSKCEHAFHVVAKATNFVARNNVITDFNAHFKINGDGTYYPDHGLIDSNTLTNTGIRNTANPVTPIDLVGASNWRIQRNLISDFIKGQGNRISYGGFAKGAGSGNRFERNIVLCENLLRGAPGQRVGLSLGGGGTGAAFCRDQRCITEQERGIIQSNLIASCSDDGIYINRAAASRIVHNSVLDTGGITVRFTTSSADVEGNLVDGVIRSRDDSVVRAADNMSASTTGSYLGWHRIRNLYRQADKFDLAWQQEPPRRAIADERALPLCTGPASPVPVYGAFEDFAGCLRADR